MKEVYIIVKRVGGGWQGPQGLTVYCRKQAEKALELYEQGLLGEGKFQILALPYETCSSENVIGKNEAVVS